MDQGDTERETRRSYFDFKYAARLKIHPETGVPYGPTGQFGNEIWDHRTQRDSSKFMYLDPETNEVRIADVEWERDFSNPAPGTNSWSPKVISYSETVRGVNGEYHTEARTNPDTDQEEN